MAKGKKTGGRRPGSRNKVPAALKDMILTALSEAGGVAYLTKQANEHPAPFMALLGKVLPQQVDASMRRIDLSKYTDDELDLLESLIAKVVPTKHDEGVH